VTRALAFDPNGWEDYVYWQTQDRKALKRINLLIADVLRDPFEGIGKPEPLRHVLSGAWSRRIDEKHRLVYPHNPTQFSRQWRERVLKAVAAHPDLDELHLHELRHTHATLLLRAGVHSKIVSEWLGHADIQTTLNTYSHAVRTLQRGAADLVRQLLGPQAVELV
jgi:Txe/YoeB family toxin of toxin-antitoxin system